MLKSRTNEPLGLSDGGCLKYAAVLQFGWCYHRYVTGLGRVGFEPAVNCKQLPIGELNNASVICVVRDSVGFAAISKNDVGLRHVSSWSNAGNLCKNVYIIILNQKYINSFGGRIRTLGYSHS